MNESCPHVLSDAERLDWLRLIRSENVGPITFWRLMERFGSAGRALDALPDLARRGGRGMTACAVADAEREMESVVKAGARLVARGEPDYPPLLAHIEDAPPLLAMIGSGDLFANPAVAVVGARNASINGTRFAQKLAADLGGAGVLVVSGLARGIDAAAHAGALETGTAAVVAGGIDVVYPEENAALRDEIAERGALVSEVEPGVQPQASHFPRRNRLISGIARGTVVVEAGPRSGSLITARMALEQGREVFAVPGSPLDPRSRGGNDLLRQGATLTESAEDVLTVLAEMAPARRQPTPADFLASEPEALPGSDLDAAHRAVTEMLSPVPVTVDELVRACHMSPAVVATAVLELELAGRLERHPGNRISLIANVRADGQPQRGS